MLSADDGAAIGWLLGAAVIAAAVFGSGFTHKRRGGGEAKDGGEGEGGEETETGGKSSGESAGAPEPTGLFGLGAWLLGWVLTLVGGAAALVSSWLVWQIARGDGWEYALPSAPYYTDMLAHGLGADPGFILGLILVGLTLVAGFALVTRSGAAGFLVGLLTGVALIFVWQLVLVFTGLVPGVVLTFRAGVWGTAVGAFAATVVLSLLAPLAADRGRLRVARVAVLVTLMLAPPAVLAGHRYKAWVEPAPESIRQFLALYDNPTGSGAYALADKCLWHVDTDEGRVERVAGPVMYVPNQNVPSVIGPDGRYAVSRMMTSGTVIGEAWSKVSPEFIKADLPEIVDEDITYLVDLATGRVNELADPVPYQGTVAWPAAGTETVVVTAKPIVPEHMPNEKWSDEWDLRLVTADGATASRETLELDGDYWAVKERVGPGLLMLGRVKRGIEIVEKRAVVSDAVMIYDLAEKKRRLIEFPAKTFQYTLSDGAESVAVRYEVLRPGDLRMPYDIVSAAGPAGQLTEIRRVAVNAKTPEADYMKPELQLSRSGKWLVHGYPSEESDKATALVVRDMEAGRDIVLNPRASEDVEVMFSPDERHIACRSLTTEESGGAHVELAVYSRSEEGWEHVTTHREPSKALTRGLAWVGEDRLVGFFRNRLYYIPAGDSDIRLLWQSEANVMD
jgi:hypothetical protein